ncbi:MAG: DUF4266 domain-containing protein [Deltaproteobacteria bacterium]|nr:MAG: DUF4266 domain-containing protein [Deltaproteobacteria bacterium]TMQ14859.1 MAG: DUF4266 domain-containing protein [Deltaproteobacteria bacterium]
MVAAAVRQLSWFAVRRAFGPGHDGLARSRGRPRFAALGVALPFWLAFGLVLGALGSSGCVAVHAHERGNLAKRAMTGDRDVGESRFAEHERGAREGAEGGTGQPGGGCGCN